MFLKRSILFLCVSAVMLPACCLELLLGQADNVGSKSNSVISYDNPKVELRLDQNQQLCSTVKTRLEAFFIEEKGYLGKDRMAYRRWHHAVDGLAGGIEWQTENVPKELGNVWIDRWGIADVNHDGKMEYLADQRWDDSNCCIGANFSIYPVGTGDDGAAYIDKSTRYFYRDGIASFVNSTMSLDENTYQPLATERKRPIYKEQAIENKVTSLLYHGDNFNKIFGFDGNYYILMRGEYLENGFVDNRHEIRLETDPPRGPVILHNWVLILKLQDWWFMPALAMSAELPKDEISKRPISSIPLLIGNLMVPLIDVEPICGLAIYLK